MSLRIDHPRPRLRRDRFTSLDGPWDFVRDPENRGLTEGWHHVWPVAPDQATITVPFAPEWEASGVTGHQHTPVVWYHRAVALPDDAREGEHVMLHFGAVDHTADVWIDGEHVAHHSGGYTPFRTEVSRLLAREGEHHLVVRVVDDNTRMDQPRGKQHWYGVNESIWYTPTTGIWQSVWLEPVAPSHVVDLVSTPDIGRGLLHVEAVLPEPLTEAGSGDVTVEVSASFEGAPVAWGAARIDRRGRAAITLSLREQHAGLRGDDLIDAGGVKLWSPDRPNLYQLEVVVKQGGEVVDTVSSHAGMREIQVIDGRLCLNRRPYPQRLVLDQGYWPETGLTPPSAEALVRDIELSKELGFNGARKHQKIEDPRFMYAADVLGFLVWDELPSAYSFTPNSVAELSTMLTELIARDRSHPSVVTWVPMNESWGMNDLTSPLQQHLQATLYHLAHAIDGSRPVVGNDGWEQVATDIMAVHDYRTPDQVATGFEEDDAWAVRPPAGRRLVVGDEVTEDAPWLMTEFGGLSLSDDDGWGYHSVKNGDELLAETAALIEALKQGPWQGYCWTQLTDVGTELNGMLTFDRKHKLDAARLKAVQEDFRP
ncbi:glycoside hydrolase family 2 protein [Aestuariimicrobium kwangyangense]|uniref:glycoside hydrolase family 2 protein n=1 Tax=Aestuariimicrobium kwangyangense TaxID=396389 RepID=UPI0003B57DAD|nr:glycoside hydrolase family 2 [Aestuariimicrobium kwangyangense]